MIIDNLDLLISVDAALVHLSGAMNKKAFFLSPYIKDWRWSENQGKSIWYDSVELISQNNTCKWDEVFKVLNIKLSKLKNKIIQYTLIWFRFNKILFILYSFSINIWNISNVKIIH